MGVRFGPPNLLLEMRAGMGKGKSLGRTIAKRPLPPTINTDDADPQKLTQAIGRAARNPLRLITDELAGNSLHFKNWYYRGGSAHFVYKPHLWYVDKMYPNAKGGMLLIDEPNTEEELADCKTKGEHLKKLGYRYLVVTREKNLDSLKAELESLDVVVNSQQ